jgi:hypothetical protein
LGAADVIENGLGDLDRNAEATGAMASGHVFSSVGSYRVIKDEDLADDAMPGKLYLVGEDRRYWIAALRWPCGCGTMLAMNPVA